MKLDFETLSDGEVEDGVVGCFPGKVSRKGHFILHPTKNILPVQDFVLEPDLISGKLDVIDDKDDNFLDDDLALVAPAFVTNLHGLKNVIKPRSLH